MTCANKTYKDQFKRSEKAVKEPPKVEKGGHHNLIREAQEELLLETEEFLEEIGDDFA